MIPAGIAFAEEEVIIIEEPVAAEEVVEEVVEVEPVEVEPVEEDIEVAPADELLDELELADALKLKNLTNIEYPSCTQIGSYTVTINGQPKHGTIKALGHHLAYTVRKDDGNLTTEAKCEEKAISVAYCDRTYKKLDGTEVAGCGNKLLTVEDGGKKLTGHASLTLESLDSTESSGLTGVTTEKFDKLPHSYEKKHIDANCSSAAGWNYVCSRCVRNKVDSILKSDKFSGLSGDYTILGNNFDPDDAGLIDKNGFIADKSSKPNPANHNVSYWSKSKGFDVKGLLDGTSYTSGGGTVGKIVASDSKTLVTYDTDVGAHEPTCELPGLALVKCEACDGWFEQETEKVAHKADPDGVVKVEATCYSDGVIEYPCIMCGTILETASIPGGHDYADTKGGSTYTWTEGLEFEDESGNTWQYGIIVCKICGFRHIEVKEISGSFAATFNAKPAPCASHHLVTLTGYAATLTTDGLTDGEWCDVCGEVTKPQKVIPPLSAKLEKDANGKWIYTVNGEQDKDYVGLVGLDGEKFFVRNGVVDTGVNGIQQPDPADGTWYFFANGQVQKNHKGFALYDGAWFYINDAGILDEDADGYYEYDGAKFLVTGGWVRTDYTGMYPDNSAQTSFKYVNGGMWMEDFTGSVTIDGETWNVTKGVATK